MPKGGLRAGAGRKKKAEQFARPIAQAEKRLADALPWVLDGYLELARGVVLQAKDPMSGQPLWEIDKKTGRERPVVYQQAPDRKACEYIMNRIMGSPVQKQDITSSDGSLPGVVIYMPDNGRDDPGVPGDG